jgi:hypothetical protein
MKINYNFIHVNNFGIVKIWINVNLNTLFPLLSVHLHALVAYPEGKEPLVASV